MKFITISALFALAFACTGPDCRTGVTGLKGRPDHSDDKGCSIIKDDKKKGDRLNSRGHKDSDRTKKPETVPQRRVGPTKGRATHFSGSGSASSGTRRPYYRPANSRTTDNQVKGRRTRNDNHKNGDTRNGIKVSRGADQGCVVLPKEPVVIVNSDPIPAQVDEQAPVLDKVQGQADPQDQANADNQDTTNNLHTNDAVPQAC